MPKKLLIIDDDKDMLEMLHIIFQDTEIDVVLSNTGMTGDEVKVIHPDIILLDVQIKGYKASGNEICKEIKSRLDIGSIPVYLISSEQNLKNLADDCKADGYFPKPFDIKNLKSMVMSKLI